MHLKHEHQHKSSTVLVVLGRVKQKNKIFFFGKQKKKPFYGRRQTYMKWLLGTMFYMLEQGFDDDDGDNVLYWNKIHKINVRNK